MRRPLKIFGFVCTVALLVVFVIGCGGGKNDSSATGKESTGSTQQSSASGNNSKNDSPEPVVLRFSWWGTDPRHQATLEVIELYEQRNPHVTIEAEYMGADGYKEKLMTQFAGGTAPDIIQVDPPWLFDWTMQFQTFADLRQFPELDLTGFDSEFLKNYGEVEGVLVGLPTGVSGITMLINTAVLEQAGIPADTVWDWDTILELGPKVNEMDKDAYFLVTDQFNTMVQILPPYLKQKTGNQIVNDDYTLGFTRDDLIDALTYFRKLFDTKVVEPAAQQYMYKAKYFENPVWTNAKAGSTIDWISTIVARKEPFKDTADVVLPPLAKDARDSGIIVRPAQMLSINSKSKHQDEAAKFLNFFFNDEEALKILKDVRAIPPTEIGRKVTLENNLIDPLVIKALEQSSAHQGMPDNVISLNIQLQNIMIDTLEKIGFGKMTPQEAADDMIKQFELKLKELQQQQQ